MLQGCTLTTERLGCAPRTAARVPLLTSICRINCSSTALDAPAYLEGFFKCSC
jgi:hypothetical protein